MLHLASIRKDPEKFKKSLERKGVLPKIIDNLLKEDLVLREYTKLSESLKSEQNKISKLIPSLSGDEKKKNA
jgi:seryl-tRNA synthetase